MTAASPPAQDVTLDAKVAFLQQPTSFDDQPFRVETIESHMSWVFLTRDHAYKLKKPVRYTFLDFSTIESRHFFCTEELRLNRRLAPDVYLGVLPLTLESPGHLHINGVGPPVDWLVKMRRLPLEHMLDYAIDHATVQEADIRAIADRLAAFYENCPPLAVDATAYREHFVQQIDAAAEELALPSYALPADEVAAVCTMLNALVVQHAADFDARVRAGKIVEGHGDLRPEHVCLHPVLAIIDCLEFSAELRTVDRVDEVAFLALECERLGVGALGDILLRRYADLSGDAAPVSLIHFYQSYRAILRALISIRHVNEEKFRYSPQWPARARLYLRLAKRHAEQGMSRRFSPAAAH